MKLLAQKEIDQVSGAFHISINIGTVIAGATLGFITAGPVGLGYALCVAVMAEGINRTNSMFGGIMDEAYRRAYVPGLPGQ